MNLAWLTDIHLNFIDKNQRKIFYQEIVKTQCDGVLISGDIAESPCLEDILNEMASYINKPIYFVLGNHDYYRGQIARVREAMIALTGIDNNLFWLPASAIKQINKDTVLVGQDGWADGRFGDYQNSTAAINDSRMISDLFQVKILGRTQLLEKMQQLADADVNCLKENLFKAASKNPKKIIVLTHVPPFKEVCQHEGRISDDNWLPYFSSKVMGDLLLEIAQNNSNIEFLVLCGHTHSAAIYQPISNLLIEAGSAEYAQPKIQKQVSL